MSNENMNGLDIRLTTRSSASHTKQRLLLLQGLWCLMALQYGHEGHIDEPVLEHFTVELFELEEHHSKYVEALGLSEAPF